MNKKLVFFIILLISICAVSHVSAADNVNDTENVLTEGTAYKFNSTDTFTDIKSAIESANEGDTFYLNGTFEFTEQITVSKSVTIEGSDDGATIKPEGFTMNKFSFFNINSSASNVVLKNLKFTYAETSDGAVLWQGDNGVIINCEFNKNIASNRFGGAIYLNASNCNITNCYFTDNQAHQGGAIFISGQNNKITSCKFNNNYVKGSNSSCGGAVYSNCENLLINNCNFTNNYATDCGGAVVINGRSNTISKSLFRNNHVDGSNSTGGGAVFSNFGTLTIDNSTFNENKASSSKGGAVILGEHDTLKYSSFANNSAVTGNDIYTNVSANVLSCSFIIKHNETKNDAVYGISESDLSNFNNNFTVIKIDSTVTFSAGIIFEYGSTSAPILVSVKGGKIDSGTIKVLNHPEAVISFSNNILTVSNLAVGKYILRATTIPDENYYSISSDLNITVNKAVAVISASSVTVALKKGTAWTIKLINSKTGKAIANMKLTLKVYTGKKYKTVTVKTNSKGIATFKTGSLAKGKHKVVVSGSHVGYTFKTVTSYIKVVKQTALKFKLENRKNTKARSLISFQVINKKTKKPVNGVKVKFKIYTGKKYKTITVKTRTISKVKGIAGFSTNEYSVGKHKVVVVPSSIKYKGSGKSSIVIKKTAKNYPAKTTTT